MEIITPIPLDIVGQCTLVPSLTEVFGWEAKFCALDLYEEITNLRWERNVGLKSEYIRGNYEQNLFSNVDIYAKRISEYNPTAITRACPKKYTVNEEMVQHFKTCLKDDRDRVIRAVKDKTTETTETMFLKAALIEMEIKDANIDINDANLKLSDLKSQIGEYKVETSKLFENIASGSISLSAAALNIKLNGKNLYIAKSLAQFGGKIKGQ